MARALAAAFAAALFAVCAGAAAQGFPSRPITLICPWPAGGGTDHADSTQALWSRCCTMPSRPPWMTPSI